MNDVFTDWKNAAITLLGALVAVLSFIGRGALKRLEWLEKNAATKADTNQRHQENLERLDRIETATTGTHKRIDELYRDLPNLVKRER
jgi:Ser/Thr protein kinase RdoA (MazF antagonist)